MGSQILLPGADHGRKITVAGLPVSGFWRKFKMVKMVDMVDEASHSTDLSVSDLEGHSIILLAHYIFGL